MKLSQLRYLLAIVDSGLNISVAALRLNATQPGISRQLKQMEDELGFQVFVRKGKALAQLTGAGAALVERARLILGEVHNIEAIAANHRHETRGTLRIAATQALGRFVLPPALGRLRARFGNLQFRLRPGGGEQECVDLLERDEIDLALISTEGERPAQDLAIPLFRWNRAFIAGRGHALCARAGALTLADIAAFPLIAAETATDLNHKVGRAFHAEGLSPDIACTARDADTIKTLVRLELGLGLVAEMALTPEDRDLVDLAAGHLLPSCITWAVLRHDRIQRDYVSELISDLAPGLSREDVRRAVRGDALGELIDRIRWWRERDTPVP